MSKTRHTRYNHIIGLLLRDKNCRIEYKNIPLKSTNITENQFLMCNEQIRKILKDYDNELNAIFNCKNKQIIFENDNLNRFCPNCHWDYWNSVFFALSIVTTIGYGII